MPLKILSRESVLSMVVNKIKALFMSIQFITYVTYGICMANLIPYLDTLGYNAIERGYILSAYAVSNIVLQILLGYLSDKFNTIKSIVMTLFCFYAFTSLMVYTGIVSNYIALLLTVSISVGGLNTLCGMQDTWIMLVGSVYADSLSVMKAFGSIGWAIGSLISSAIISVLGYAGIGWVILIGISLTVALAWQVPDSEKEISDDKVTMRDLTRLFKINEYVLLIIALFLMYGLIVVNTTLVVDKMLSLQASNFHITLKWAMGSLLEIPMYLLCMPLIKRYGSMKLLLFSTIVLIVQFVLFALSTSVSQIILITLLQIFTTPIILVTSKRVINQIVPRFLKSSGQMVALSTFMGGSSLLVPVLNGYLTKSIGINNALFLYVIFGVISLVILILLKWKITE